MKPGGWTEKRKGNGRRKVDDRECPFHSLHEKQIQGLEKQSEGLQMDMKHKISFRVFSLIVLAILTVSGVSWKLLDKYITTTGASATALIQKHIVKSDAILAEVNRTLKRVEIHQRVILYRLDRLDKTPENSNAWRKPEI
jgi:hypothetical protein